MGVARVGIKHLFRVSVIRSDAEHVARFFTSIVDGLDSIVSGTDGLNGRIVYTSVSDLFSVCCITKNSPCLGVQSCT